MNKSRSGQWSVISGQWNQALPAHFLATGHWPLATAFTLIELIISLVLMLMLMLGVNYVFGSVGRATGTVQAMSNVTRTSQAAQKVMAEDFESAVTGADAPFFIIESAVKAAFRNQQDQLSDRDYDPVTHLITAIRSVDLNNDNDENDAGETTPNAIYNSRNHRIDQISFFSRSLFRRQTGNNGVNVADMAGSEAFISYGILRLYDGQGNLSLSPSYPYPGDIPDATNPNPNNWYASQWILGRTAMLLIEPDGVAINDPAGNPQIYYNRMTSSVQPESALRTGVDDSSAGGTWPVSSSRYDIAGTSIATERKLLVEFCTTLANFEWWTDYSYPFWANPLFIRPLDSGKISQTAPILLPGCTQFIVEFAGDYLKQNATTGLVEDAYSYIETGSATTGTTDGEIDYILSNGQRQIRWYGMPRDTDGNGLIPVSANDANAMPDVVPLRDVIMTWKSTVLSAPMERDIPPYPSSSNYAALTGGMTATRKYVVAWGAGEAYGHFPAMPPWTAVPPPPMPKLIRITFTLDDASGRLADGQTFEYVFKIQ